MSKARVVVLEVTSDHLTVTAAARSYGFSRQHIYRLRRRLSSVNATTSMLSQLSRKAVSTSTSLANNLTGTLSHTHTAARARGHTTGLGRFLTPPHTGSVVR
jgi:hypothetical protein